MYAVVCTHLQFINKLSYKAYYFLGWIKKIYKREDNDFSVTIIPSSKFPRGITKQAMYPVQFQFLKMTKM